MVEVRRGDENGPPAEGVEVRISGAAFGAEKTSIWRTTDARGTATFGPMHPDTYEIYMNDPYTGLFGAGISETVFASPEPKILRVVACDRAPREIALEFAPPLFLQGERGLALSWRTTWKHGTMEWDNQIEAVVTSDGVWGRDADVRDQERPTQINRMSWRDLRRERFPLTIAGNVDTVRVALLGSDDEGGITTLGNDIELSPSSVTALDDGSGYRLTLPGAIQRQLDIWHVADVAEARGVELENDLWTRLRQDFSEYLVTAALLVDETRVGYLADGAVYAPDPDSDFGEGCVVTGLRHFSTRIGDWDGAQLCFFRQGDSPLPELSPEARLLLAIRVGGFSVREFENDLQLWPVSSSIMDSDWPVSFDSGRRAVQWPCCIATDSRGKDRTRLPIQTRPACPWVLLPWVRIPPKSCGTSAVKAIGCALT